MTYVKEKHIKLKTNWSFKIFNELIETEKSRKFK